MRRAWAVARKELAHINRTNLFYVVVLQPLIFSLLWGYCASLELKQAKLSVFDGSSSPEGRELVRALTSAGDFQVSRQARSISELQRSLESGESGLALIVPPDLPRQLRRARPAAIELIADGTDPNLAGLGLSYATRLAANASLLPHMAAADAGYPHIAAADASVRTLYNPALRSADFLLLGAICFNLMWFAHYPAYSLLSDRERGALAALRMTRVRALDYWLGAIASHGLTCLWGTLLQLALTIFVVGVPFRGDGFLLLAGLCLYALFNLNLGLALPLVATKSAHTTVWIMMWTFVMMAFSGYLLPFSCMPSWARALGQYQPLHLALVFLRAVFQKGAGGGQLLHPLGYLFLFAAASTALALFSLGRLMRHD